MRQTSLIFLLFVTSTQAFASGLCDINSKLLVAKQNADILKLQGDAREVALGDVVTVAAEECLSQGKTFDEDAKSMIFAYATTKALIKMNEISLPYEEWTAIQKSGVVSKKVMSQADQAKYLEIQNYRNSIIERVDQSIELSRANQ